MRTNEGVYSREDAEFVCNFCECLKIPDGKHAGEPFRLMEWQREPIERFYGTKDADGVRKYRYLYLEVPKKNGKSGLAAALGLYHTFADGEQSGEVYAVAADRENAGIVFKAALEMLEECKPLLKRAKIVKSLRIIEDTVTGTVFKVMSSEAYSKHGYKPSCVIFDELHAQPNRELWDIMTFGAGAARRQPVWIVLTTAGDDPDRNSIGWEVHEKARGVLKARELHESGKAWAEDGYSIEDDEGNVYTEDPTWLPVIYAYDGDDIWNEENWIKANPAIKYEHSVTLKDIRLEAIEARQSEARERLFRWLRLNQWIAVKAVGWIPLTVWDATDAGDIREMLAGEKCYLGMDLGSTTDLTAVTAVFPPQGKHTEWLAVFWAWIPKDTMREAERRDKVPYSKWEKGGYLTATEGNAVDYESVYAKIGELRKTYKVLALGTDQWNSRMLTQKLMNDRLEIVEVPQNYSGMSPAMKDMERMLRKGEFKHERNAAARWCFGNVKCATDGNENLKPMKNKSTGRIDITVSWINAVALARTKQDMKVSVYEKAHMRMITW